MSNEEEYYTPAELAKLAGIKPQMVYNYMNSGRIEYEWASLKEGGACRYLIRKDVGDEWNKGYQERRASREDRRHDRRH